MTIDRFPWTTWAAAAALTGGLCWVAKQGVIVAAIPDDGGPPPESLPIAVLYLLGAALMVLGASGLAARATVRWPVVARVVAAVLLSPAIFWAVSTLTDVLVDAVAGPDAGWWWTGEGGILLTGLLFAVAGGVALRRGSAVAVG